MRFSFQKPPKIDLMVNPATPQVKKKDHKDAMTCKAWNGRCVLSWLSYELLRALDVHPDLDLLVLVASCTTLSFKPKLEFEKHQVVLLGEVRCSLVTEVFFDPGAVKLLAFLVSNSNDGIPIVTLPCLEFLCTTYYL